MSVRSLTDVGDHEIAAYIAGELNLQETVLIGPALDPDDPARGVYTMSLHEPRHTIRLNNVSGVARITTIGHELVHARQVERAGCDSFAVQYIIATVAHGYTGNPLEREAREVGASFVPRVIAALNIGEEPI